MLDDFEGTTAGTIPHNANWTPFPDNPTNNLQANGDGTVTYTPADGSSAVTGKVDSLAVENGTIVLKVGKDTVGLDQITAFQA